MIEISLLIPFIDALLVLSGWEVFASLLGIAYVILAARESPWCWLLAFVSTLIYTVLFRQGQLPMQALLNFYYMAMAVYGYWVWRKQGNMEGRLPIHRWKGLQHLLFIATGAVLTCLVGFYLTDTASSQSPYLDSGVTVFSVLNTGLMVRKVLQNWLYWLVIDAAAIVLYAQTGYYATIVMYSVYLILAVIGFFSWQKLYHQQVG